MTDPLDAASAAPEHSSDVTSSSLVEDDLEAGKTANEDDAPRTVGEQIKSILDEDPPDAAREFLNAYTAAAPYLPRLIFNVHDFHGNVAGRDLFGASRPGDTEKQRPGTTQVFGLSLSTTSAVYVEPPRHSEAAEILRQHHVLVLSAPSRFGKWTAALRLLAKEHEADVFQMPVETDVERLESFDFNPTAGYVIDGLPPAEAERLDRPLLQDLERRLADIDSHLIITVDSRESRLCDLTPHLLRWDEPPDPAEVFQRHVPRYAKGERANLLIDALQREPDLANALRGCAPPEIDSLVSRLSRADIEGEGGVTGVLKMLIPKGVEDWFRDHEDPRDCCHMIAFAVLSGTSYSVAAELGAGLTRLVDPGPTPAENDDTRQAPFGLRRSRILEATHARIVPGVEETGYGEFAVEQLSVDESIDRAAVLRFAWQEFDAVRGPLIEWLTDLGRNRSAAARERGAAAAGELSKIAFDEIHRRIIRVWALDHDWRTRQSAGVALGIAAWDTSSAPHALRVLHHWSRLDNNPRLQWTAAAAFGGWAGMRFPEVALEELRSILDSGPGAFHSVLAAIINLFEAGKTGSPEYHDVVLAALLKWSQERRTVGALAALSAFLRIASGSRTDASARSDRWPTLLSLCHGDPGRFEAVAAMWRRTLNERLLRQEALARLRRWVEEADENPEMQEAVRRLVRNLCDQSERERQRLHHHLGRWSRASGKGSATAAACLPATASS